MSQTPPRREYEKISLPDDEKDWEARGLLDTASPTPSATPSMPGSPSLVRRPSSPLITLGPPREKLNRWSFFFWLFINCAATVVLLGTEGIGSSGLTDWIGTVGIVLVNKIVLQNPSLRGAPVLFVSYHFFLTAATLHIASSSYVGAFERKGDWTPQISLALIFAGRTVLTNWSLALLPVAIYQELRILVTPATVLINFFAFRKTITVNSLLTLFVVCFGIGLSVWADTHARPTPLPLSQSAEKLVSRSPSDALFASPTLLIGYIFGFAGVFLSSLYSILMAVYLPKFQLSSLQLLHLQSPLGCALLAVLSPFVDTWPVWSSVTPHEYLLLFLSGLCAVLINVSQFFIVAGAGALSSTVVGHAKTVMICVGGWMFSATPVLWDSALGVVIAIGGIVAYSLVGI